jgi:hypothetical protein
MRELVLSAMLFAIPAKGDQAPTAEPAQIPASVWRVTNDIGEHLQSGLACPPVLGTARRIDLTTYDQYGLDVSCGYSTARATVTIYLTRAGDIDASYAEAQRQIRQVHAVRHVRLLSEDRVETGGLAWRRATFSEDGAMRSDLWMAPLHGWQVKYRVTYPAADAAEVAALLAKAPDLVLAPAAARLDLCAKAPTPARPGREITDRKLLADLALRGSVLGGVMLAAARDKGVSVTPSVFCVEGPVAGTTLLAWRSARPDGSDAQVDRITAMTMGPPPALDVTLDAMANLLAAEASKGPAPERWVATLMNGEHTSIYGYYDRRPDAAAVAPLMQAILSGKARPWGGYSLKDNQVNITVPPKAPGRR